MRTDFWQQIFQRIFLRTIEDTKSYCIDINECIPVGQKCGDLGRCLNSSGSYKCECKYGYVKKSDNPFKCEDKGKFEI